MAVGCSATSSARRGAAVARPSDGRGSSRSSPAGWPTCARPPARCRSAGPGLVELARAVVDEPRILLLDEPTSGLSPAEAEVFAAHLGRLRERDVAIVLVEHDVGFVMQNCDRVVVLDLGRVLADGTPDEVRDDRAVRDAYLG